MSKEISNRVGKINGVAVLKSVGPLGHYANPATPEDTTLRDLPYRLGEIAAKLGVESTEEFEYEIIVRRKAQRFFEGIGGLVEKDGELFYRGKRYGKIDKERSSYLKEYKGVIDIEFDVLSLTSQLEKRNYLLMSTRGHCLSS